MDMKTTILGAIGWKQYHGTDPLLSYQWHDKPNNKYRLQAPNGYLPLDSVGRDMANGSENNLLKWSGQVSRSPKECRSC